MPLSNLLSDTYDFATAGRAVLQFLQQRLAFDLWMVTRTEGTDWIVLQAEDAGYGVKPDTVFHWADSFCSRMVEGLGPRIAAKSRTIPAYAGAPIGQQVPIGAYVGVPLTYHDGRLFGTLCAIHPDPHPDAIAAELPLVELLAGMLSSILNNELNAIEATRRAEHARVDSETDAMTGLYNRRGLDRLLKIEEARCRRYGNSASVIAIDLNGLKSLNDSLGHAAGDTLICRAATVLRAAARESDIVARTGGDEFVILAIESNTACSNELFKRLRTALQLASVSASMGQSTRLPNQDLQHTWHEADMAMYREKADRSCGAGVVACTV